MSSQQQATTQSRLPIGLAAYSFPYSCGFLGAGTPRACPAPLDVYALIELAEQQGLAGVEYPLLRQFPDLEPSDLAVLRAAVAARGLFLVVDAGVVSVEELSRLLPAAAAIGARTLRVVASTILCGDRRVLGEGWPAYLAAIVDRLGAVRALAASCGVAVAIENHQDVTSEELIAICRQLDSPFIGVTLDVVNPLAVAEEPLRFARRIAPYLKHVHLKDYTIHPTPHGYRLVRSDIGAGVLDVPALLALLAEQAPEATVCIELAALQARHVRFLDDDFWPAYPPRPIADLLPVLRLREAAARPADEEWRTPWELEQDGGAIAAYEREGLLQSVDYLRRLHEGVPERARMP